MRHVPKIIDLSKIPSALLHFKTVSGIIFKVAPSAEIAGRPL